MKLALMTLPLGNYNYGGILQCYALSNVLKGRGHEVIVLDRRTTRPAAVMRILSKVKQWIYVNIFRIKGRYFDKKVVYRNFDDFINRHFCLSGPFYTTKALAGYFSEREFDAVIFGSDQIWRPSYMSDVTDYFGGFIPSGSDVKRIAYAASFGTDNWEYSNDETIRCRVLLKSFCGISVRESSGVKLCKDHLGAVARLLLDPVFLLDQDDYRALMSDEDRASARFALSSFLLDMTEEKECMRSLLSSALGGGSDMDISTAKYENKGKSSGSFSYPSFSTWIKAFDKGDFVFTDSYHGCVFAILFNRPFVVVANKDRGLSRFDSLLGMLGLKDRMIFSFDELESRIGTLAGPVDFSHANAVLVEKKRQSLDFLFSNLQKS